MSEISDLIMADRICDALAVVAKHDSKLEIRALMTRASERIADLERRLAEAEGAEQTRWQQAIDKLVTQYCPDADGSGCDSGDPLDVTLAELHQAFEEERQAREQAEAKYEAADFWNKWVYPEGATAEQVQNELADYHAFMDNAKRVYEHVTGGAITKVNTAAEHVITAHDDHVTKRVEEAEAEAREQAEAREAGVREALEAVEWRGFAEGCPMCGGTKHTGHVPDCRLAAALSTPSASGVMEEQPNDLFTCPNCGGPADNGFSRTVPPQPYWCSKCNPLNHYKPMDGHMTNDKKEGK